jgi:hypothetical protein
MAWIRMHHRSLKKWVAAGAHEAPPWEVVVGVAFEHGGLMFERTRDQPLQGAIAPGTYLARRDDGRTVRLVVSTTGGLRVRLVGDDFVESSEFDRFVLIAKRK